MNFSVYFNQISNLLKTSLGETFLFNSACFRFRSFKFILLHFSRLTKRAKNDREKKQHESLAELATQSGNLEKTDLSIKAGESSL